uniref:HD domain-containing protein n=1 Tax=Spongospora subterranea TaxID=70186 RepID=A0A0H5R6A9_9EUKA|eukprot:CRZ09376.1 hypothetical protein [Spongospora subterranea]
MKQIMDPIHGLIDIDPELIQMIDTPQFQRLRNISQMGPSSYVFPGATHKRFGHSIGTSSVAGDLLDNISRAQPDLKITPRETLLIKAAGLCHDLGHGPLSHSFDNFMVCESFNAPLCASLFISVSQTPFAASFFSRYSMGA